MSKKDGGSAFPVTGDNKVVETFAGSHGGEGMSLRDYFAAKALSTILVTNRNPESSTKNAYEIADAMLAERAK